MTPMRHASIRTQIVAIVMVGAIIPLAIVGAWLSSASVRSGENLLREHIVAAADRFVEAADARWAHRYADLQLIAGNEVSLGLVTGAELAAADTAYLTRLLNDLSSWIVSASLIDDDGESRWSWVTETQAQRPSTPPREQTVEYRIPVVRGSSDTAGMALVRVKLASLIPGDSGRALVAGSQVAIRQYSSAQVLVSLDPSMSFPGSDAITVRGEPWLAARRVASGPSLEVAVGAPLGAYVTPFTRAARIGFVALAAVVLFAIVLTTFLATRLTDPITHLADAADAVAAGSLDRRVAATGPVELQRLGTSFNVMTNSLRQTLEELSRRSALAAVGEFATSLSHEVRNALTSIKVDLQRAARREATDATSQVLVSRALNNVARLESTVTGSLRVARGGQIEREVVDLRAVLSGAADAVLGAFSAVPATLNLDTGDIPRPVVGDRSALDQLFTNLLFNAGQAVRPDGCVTVRLEATNGKLVTTIADDGIGMTPAQLEHLANAAYSSKPNGSGIGLPIARRIAAAHSGELHIASVPGTGTTVRVELPAADGRGGDNG